MAGEMARAEARTQRDGTESTLDSADAFETVAPDQHSTKQVLASLPSNEWRIFHDVRWPGRDQGHIDHVAVGPTGVFVIDTKMWAGNVEVRGGGLRQDGKRRSRTVVAAAAAAMAIHELVPSLDNQTMNPVLCFLREHPLFGWAGDVMVCSTHNLATFMTSRPRAFSESEAMEVATTLSLQLEAAAAPVQTRRGGPEPVPMAAPVTSGRVPRAPLSRPVRVVLRLGLVALLVALGLHFDLPSKVGDLASQAAQRVFSPTQPTGTTIEVPAIGSRPSLKITAGDPVLTTSKAKRVRPRPGHRLVAVPLTIQNTGDSAWTSRSDLRALVSAGEDVTYSSDPAFMRIAAGRALPPAMKLPPGRTRDGFMVFEVPRGTQVTKIQLSVGPGLPKKMSWQAD